MIEGNEGKFARSAAVTLGNREVATRLCLTAGKGLTCDGEEQMAHSWRGMNGA